MTPELHQPPVAMQLRGYLAALARHRGYVLLPFIIGMRPRTELVDII